MEAQPISQDGVEIFIKRYMDTMNYKASADNMTLIIGNVMASLKECLDSRVKVECKRHRGDAVKDKINIGRPNGSTKGVRNLQKDELVLTLIDKGYTPLNIYKEYGIACITTQKIVKYYADHPDIPRPKQN